MLVNNREWVFDSVDPRYSIGLLTACKEETNKGKIELVGPFTSFEKVQRLSHAEPKRVCYE